LWIGVALKMNNQHMQASQNFVHGGDVPVDYANFVFNTMATEYSSSRYEGEYFDLATNERVHTTEPVRRNFKRAAEMFVARHKQPGMGDDGGGTSGAVASALLDRARQQIDQGQFAAAMSDVQNLLRASPKDTNVLELHARCALGLGDALTAREEFTRVLTADTRKASAYLQRARAQAMIGAERRAKTDLMVAAILDRAAADRQRREIEGLMRQNAAQTLEPVAALAALKQAAESGASAADLRAKALDVLRSMNNRRLRCDETYQDGLREREEALAAAPRDPDRLAALADFLYQESSVQREKVEPRAAPRLFRHQTVESQKAELERAMKLCDEALSINPRHVGAMTTKAATLSWWGRYGDAQQIVRAALDVAPNDTRLLQVMASLLEVAAAQKSAQAAGLRETKTWYSGDWMYTRWPSQAELAEASALEIEAERLAELARQHLGKAVVALQGKSEGFYLQSTLARDRGDHAAAREAMLQAVNLKPDYREAWSQLAAIYSDLDMTNKSVMARSTAANLVHTTAAHLLVLAQVQINRTAFRSALEALDQAMALDPADPRSLLYPAVLHEAQEKPEIALNEWRAAVALIEACCAQHGHAFADGNAQSAATLPLNPDDLGLLLVGKVRLARAMEAQGKSDEALQHYRAVLAMRPQVSSEMLIELLPSATLPDPEGDLTVVPEADPPALFFGWAHLGSAKGALAAANPTRRSASTWRRWRWSASGRRRAMDASGFTRSAPGRASAWRRSRWRRATSTPRSGSCRKACHGICPRMCRRNTAIGRKK
jgi:Tfp pilus assembly protein PilF